MNFCNVQSNQLVIIRIHFCYLFWLVFEVSFYLIYLKCCCYRYCYYLSLLHFRHHFRCTLVDNSRKISIRNKNTIKIRSQFQISININKICFHSQLILLNLQFKSVYSFVPWDSQLVTASELAPFASTLNLLWYL